MTNSASTSSYSSAEEWLNVVSHGIGFVLSIIALGLLIQRALTFDNAVYLVSFGVFGITLVVLYGSSTSYHRAKDPDRRAQLRVLDHASIYGLIAGTYTPFALLTLPSGIGWVLFTTSWTMAFAGIFLKFFFTGKYKLLSTLMYVFMGWLIVFAIRPLIESISPAGLNWLVAGGAAYTIGAVLYSIKKIPFNHAIFHTFVLLGSSCHFFAVYLHVV